MTWEIISFRRLGSRLGSRKKTIRYIQQNWIKIDNSNITRFWKIIDKYLSFAEIYFPKTKPEENRFVILCAKNNLYPLENGAYRNLWVGMREWAENDEVDYNMPIVFGINQNFQELLTHSADNEVNSRVNDAGGCFYVNMDPANFGALSFDEAPDGSPEQIENMVKQTDVFDDPVIAIAIIMSRMSYRGLNADKKVIEIILARLKAFAVKAMGNQIMTGRYIVDDDTNIYALEDINDIIKKAKTIDVDNLSINQTSDSYTNLNPFLNAMLASYSSDPKGFVNQFDTISSKMMTGGQGFDAWLTDISKLPH